MFYRSLIPAFLGVFLLISYATAEDRYTPLNTALMKEVVLPNFLQLANAALVQQQTWNRVCASPSPGGNSQLQKAFHKTMDAWALVFHWNIGPMTHYLRREKLYHWPERRNSIAKGLTKLLARKQPEKLAPKRFSKASVAVQGLPALERLLFEDINVTENAWACQIGGAIASNVATVANDVEREWRDEVAPLLYKGEPHPDFFEEPSDFMNRLFNELVTGYRIIKDQKILMVTGADGKSTKPGRIENRRSKRFEKNLALNLQGLYQAQAVVARFLSDDHQMDMKKQIKDVRSALKKLGDFETGVKSGKIQPQIKLFLSALDVVRDQMAKDYVEQLQLVVGFNSLDGD